MHCYKQPLKITEKVFYWFIDVRNFNNAATTEMTIAFSTPLNEETMKIRDWYSAKSLPHENLIKQTNKKEYIKLL